MGLNILSDNPVSNALLGGPKTTSQVAMMDPAQAAARAKLLNFSKTGKFGDFTAGASIPMGYGDFNATGTERAGLSGIDRLMAAPTPAGFQMGNEALQGFLNPDPSAIMDQFSPFKAQVERQIGTSQRDLKRSAGFAGNLYSTKTVQGLGDVQARGNEMLASKMSDLTNQAADRRLQAVPLAYQGAQAEQNTAMQRIDASMKYGDLMRSLNDASIKARDAELLRRRQELQLPINAANTLATSNVQFGVPSVTSSPYQQLLGGVMGGVGQGAGMAGGAGIMQYMMG